MGIKKLLDILGVKMQQENSIYRYSPVYRVTKDNKNLILKKTKTDAEKSKALIQWQKHMQESDVAVVVPVKETVLFQDERWVLYPFIHGSKFNGCSEQIKSSGRLLGQMHSQSLDKILKNGFDWDDFDDEFISEIMDDLKIIEERYLHSPLKVKNFKEYVEGIVEDRFKDLVNVDLPRVNCSWDYKGNNLIFDNASNPTIIDTDNGGWVPRILDLALSLLLFNTENEGSPARIFTHSEWNLFLEGYYEFITLSELEKSLWHRMLEFVYVDEALWAIIDLEDNETERQKEFIKSLLDFRAEEYNI